jgi:hypothetical protein
VPAAHGTQVAEPCQIVREAPILAVNNVVVFAPNTWLRVGK